MKISISDEIYEKIKERIKDTNFKSVEKYVNFVMEKVISEEEEKKMFTKKEEKKMKERLKTLGYLE